MYEDDEAWARELKRPRIEWGNHNYETRCKRPDLIVLPRGKRGRPKKVKTQETSK